MTSPFIDFHTHKINQAKGTVSIFSHHCLNEEPHITTPNFFSSGAHPWFTPPELATKSLLNRLMAISQKPRFLCVGEIGLDRLRGPSLEDQLEVFQTQLKWAGEINSPAIVLHCVRAFDVFLKILKESEFQGAFIFHDYSGNKEITESLLQDSRVYFSLGRVLLRSSASEHFYSLPTSRIFFETDDGEETIEAIYSAFCLRRKLPLSDLKKAIVDNFEHLFQLSVN